MLSISLWYFLAAFATIVGIVWAGTQLFKPQDDPLGDRLSLLVNAGPAASAQIKRSSRGFSGRFLNLVSAIPGGEDWIKGSQKRLRQAGYRNEKTLGIYILIAVGVLAAALGGMLWLQRSNDGSSMLGGMVSAGIIGFIGPQFVLGKLANRYKQRLQDGLPDTIDLLGIVLGTGLALDQALLRVTEELQFIYPELSSEFYTVVMQVRAGQERAKAFSAMVRRTGIEDLRSLSAMIIQSERFGTSLAQALTAYANDLRGRRRLRAEAAVGKAGIKMLFPIVLFILPVLFVVTLVPGILSTIHDLALLGGGR